LPIPVEAISSGPIQRLIDDMFETMREYAGIGLAAPQVHEGVRLFVAGLRPGTVSETLSDDVEMPFIALINPEISVITPAPVAGWEGCLSIPDIRGLVPRPSEIRVKALDREGRPVSFTASGLPARVIQHEYDHLDGVLFFDRMKSLESLTFLDEYRRYWTKDDEE
jgi:peptide deformylase